MINRPGKSFSVRVSPHPSEQLFSEAQGGSRTNDHKTLAFSIGCNIVIELT